MAEELSSAGKSVPPDETSDYGWLDQKLQTTTTVKDLQALVKLRGDLIRQDQQVVENQHRRKMDVVQTIANVAKSAAGLGVGTYLTVKGYTYPGMFALGVSLYSVAPKFVSEFFRNWMRHKQPEKTDSKMSESGENDET